MSEKRLRSSYVLYRRYKKAAEGAAIAGAALTSYVSWWHVAVWGFLVARAAAVPLARRAGRGPTVTQIGVLEIFTSILVTLTLLV